MNIIQRFLVKQFTQVSNNQLLNNVFKYWGINTPVWIEDCPESYIEHGYAGNADVYSIIKRICDLASVIPWKVQQKKNGKWVDVYDHELQYLIESPNPIMSQSDFISSLMGYYLLTGNTYTYAPFIENGLNQGKTQELWPMAAHIVNIKFGNVSDPIIGYYYNNSPESLIKPSDVCHVKTWNPNSNGYSFYGMSPLKPGSKNVKLGNSAITTSVKSFDNMGPDGIISRDGDEFTPEQASNLENRWRVKYTGPENAKKIVMTGASIKWTQIGQSPVDLGILPREIYNMGQLCNIYGAPVQLFNNTDKTAFNNMDSAHKQMYLHAVLPPLNAIRDGFNRWLTPRYGKDLWLTPDIDTIEVLQSNKKEEVDWLAAAWWIKGIDKQRMMGVTEDAEMDKYFIPANLLASDAETMPDEVLKLLKDKGVEDYGK